MPTPTGQISKTKGVSMKQFVEDQIKNKNSSLNLNIPNPKNTNGMVNGIDLQQKYINSIITTVESVAYNLMAKEFPQLATIEEEEMSNLKDAYKDLKKKKKSAITILTE